MSVLQDNRAILWGLNEKEKEDLQGLDIVTLPTVTKVKFTPWCAKVQNSNIKVECKHSWIGVEALPLHLFSK